MPETTTRSTFVTVVAWVFIALAGFASLIAIMQNVMIQTVFEPALRQAAPPAAAAGLPAPFTWITMHMAWFFRAFLLLALVTLTAAIGLLQRRNWARMLFIALLLLAIVYQLAGLLVQWWVLGSMGEVMTGGSEDFARGMRTMLIVMRVFGVVVALGMCGLFGWLIVRLRRPLVLREFGVPTG